MTIRMTVSKWNEILEKFTFFKNHKIEENIESILHHATDMAKIAGFNDAVHLTPIACGGNNRVFQMQTGDGKFLLKNYFYSNEDKRDRLRPNSYLHLLRGNTDYILYRAPLLLTLLIFSVYMNLRKEEN